MKSRNAKVFRMLSTMAITLKDEKPELIKALSKDIADERDGYDYNLFQIWQGVRCSIVGRSF